jgi:N-acetylmuramic acid 6-phosphate (MurNAc-6-P) etherase
LGPELLTGSTRLKAGTATKLLLNIFSTLAMVRIGKVMGNLMVDLSPSNAKLRERATRIVQQLAGLDSLSARAALEQNQWMIKKAVSRPGRK